jgi:predicted small integral membrane protein
VISRVGKTLFAATLGIFYLLIGIDNIIDYQTNFHFVEHVLQMDSIPTDAHIQWRAIYSSHLHHLAYWTVILWELVAGWLCATGAFQLFKARRDPEYFAVCRTRAIAGLWVGLLLWSLAFITVGGEWFMMWESNTWNGELPALRMFTLNSFALLFLYLPESGSA